MNVDSFSLLSLTNQTSALLQSFALQLEHFVGVALKTTSLIRRNIGEVTRDWSSPIAFTPLQLTLLKVLLILLLGTAGLIAYSWYRYGKVITEKFVRASTLKEIEELKLSVAKLKLPKEHSPRI